MYFLYPSFLWAFFALLVPIIIHLFNFKKYKVVYFTNVRFLKDLQEKSKAKSRLKEWLVFMMRCFTIIALVLAFAQPFLPGLDQQTNTGKNIYSLYIDNSFSTQNVNKLGPVLDIEKAKAKELVKSLNNADKIQIITNDFEGKHQRLHTKQDAISVIDEIKISPVVRPIHLVLQRQEAFLKQFSAEKKQIFVFSDLQKTGFTVHASKVDTAIKVFIFPVLPNVQNNIYIDSCWFESPMQQLGFVQHLNARVINAGDNNIDVLSAKLIINKKQTALNSFSLAPRGEALLKFSFTGKEPGFNFGEIQIDDYPITFDDHLRFAFNATKNIDVVLINGKIKEDRLSKLFKSDSLFVLHQVTEAAIDYALFKNADVIVLNQLGDYGSGLISELTTFTKKGGSLVVLPAMQNNLSGTIQFYQSLNLPNITALDTTTLKCSEIDQNKGFFEGVFEKKVEHMQVPVIKQHYQYQLKPGMSSILTLQNGDVLLAESQINKAKLFVFASALATEAGNLNNHAILIPTFYKMCFAGLTASPLYFTAGGNGMLELPANPDFAIEAPTVKNLLNNADFIPEYKVFLNTTRFYFAHQPQEPGFYLLNHRNRSLQALAFNYSHLESDLSTYTAEALQQILDEKHYTNYKVIDYQTVKNGELITLVNGGKKLWKLFLLLALTFITAEVLILRFLKQ